MFMSAVNLDSLTRESVELIHSGNCSFWHFALKQYITIFHMLMCCSMWVFALAQRSFRLTKRNNKSGMTPVMEKRDYKLI